jgi:hypothetical protein
LSAVLRRRNTLSGEGVAPFHILRAPSKLFDLQGQFRFMDMTTQAEMLAKRASDSRVGRKRNGQIGQFTLSEESEEGAA